MRRIHGILIFSILGILQLSVPALAQSPKGSFSDQDTDSSLVRFPHMELVGIEAEPGVQFMPERLGETQGNLIRLSKAEEADGSQEDLLEESVSDPLEPINRVFFNSMTSFIFGCLNPLQPGTRQSHPSPSGSVSEISSTMWPFPSASSIAFSRPNSKAPVSSSLVLW